MSYPPPKRWCGTNQPTADLGRLLQVGEMNARGRYLVAPEVIERIRALAGDVGVPKTARAIGLSEHVVRHILQGGSVMGNSICKLARWARQ